MTGEGRRFEEPDRVELEAVHARRLDEIERQLLLARDEARRLGASTGAIDDALVGLGSQALKRSVSGRLLPTGKTRTA